MSPSRPFVVGIGGTTREGSTSEQALRFTLNVVEDLGAESLLLGAKEIDLPVYRPDTAHRTPRARRLVEALRDADGALIVSPVYHGGMSGLMKNALDYAEDLRDDSRPYLDERPVGCIVTGAGWQGSVTTLTQIRMTAHSLRAWPTPLGVVINSSLPCVDDHGLPAEPYREELSIVARHVVGFARGQLGAGANEPVGAARGATPAGERPHP